MEAVGTPTGRPTAIRTPPSHAAPTSPALSSPGMDQVKEFMNTVAWLLPYLKKGIDPSYLFHFAVVKTL